ncbi:MAG: GNAT family N-acetyltransferase [Phycisphaeraceae bacterium]|nr:GNAT family N-acetyltransferase [Phycisphaeraceae bacterium]
MHTAQGERLARKIRVRPLEPEDSLAHLTGLLHRAYKVHADAGLRALAGFQPEEVTRKRISGGRCLVATYLGRVVGTILFKDSAATTAAWPDVAWSASPQHPERTGAVATFSQFAVEPDFQGRGIGGELMFHVERLAAESGAGELSLSTPEPATWLVAMYERHGYRIVERIHWPETNYTSVIMSKPLAAVGR